MSRRDDRRAYAWALGWMALVPAAAIFVSCAPPAHATPVQDSAFLAVLDTQGIQYKSATTVITAGYAVCELRSQGATELEVAEEVYQRTDLDAYNSGFFVGAAEAAYCPWFVQGGKDVSAQTSTGRRLV